MSISELLSEYGDMYVQAFLGTWWMSLVSFAFAMLLALIITVFRVCPIKPLRVVGDLYVQIFRNIPGVSLLIILVPLRDCHGDSCCLGLWVRELHEWHQHHRRGAD